MRPERVLEGSVGLRVRREAGIGRKRQRPEGGKNVPQRGAYTAKGIHSSSVATKRELRLAQWF